MNLHFTSDSTVFNCRVMGVCIKNNKLLLCRKAGYDYWIFPGGRALLGESTEEAILREYREETCANLKIGHLSAIAENFFTLDGKTCHQFLFFYVLKDENGGLELFEGERPVADNEHEVFRWFDISELDSIEIQPHCCREMLQNIGTGKLIHMVNKNS